MGVLTRAKWPLIRATLYRLYRRLRPLVRGLERVRVSTHPVSPPPGATPVSLPTLNHAEVEVLPNDGLAPLRLRVSLQAPRES